MLNDDRCRFVVKLLDGLNGSVQINDIVKGELLALQLQRVGDTGLGDVPLHIEGS